VLSIKNTALRRLALVTAFPAVMVWESPAFLIMPFVVAWRCAVAAWGAAGSELHDNWCGYESRLLRVGFWAIWSREAHRDFQAAIAEAKLRVYGR
jgi:hypothetical protein